MEEALGLAILGTSGNQKVTHSALMKTLQKRLLAALEPSVLFGVLAVLTLLQPLTYDHFL